MPALPISCSGITLSDEESQRERTLPPIWVWLRAVCKAVNRAPNTAFGHWSAQAEGNLVLASGVLAAGAGGRRRWGRVSGRAAACPLLRGGCRRPG
jgi:hypothetical protein